jgi:hypothetical protein
MDSTNRFRNAVRALVVALVAAGFAHAANAQVVGTEGWIEAAKPGASTTGYVVLTNRGDEEAQLLRIISPASDHVMIFRSTLDSEGARKLWPVGFLHMQPGEVLRFDPKGLIVRFDDLKEPVVAGQKVPLQIMFDHQAEFTVMLEVRPAAAASTGPGAASRRADKPARK